MILKSIIMTKVIMCGRHTKYRPLISRCHAINRDRCSRLVAIFSCGRRADGGHASRPVWRRRDLLIDAKTSTIDVDAVFVLAFSDCKLIEFM